MAEVRPKPAVLSVTDAAAARIREIVARADKPVAGVRLGIRKGGCAGMTYTMDIAETVAKGDEVVDANGVRVLIDPAAVLFLFGTEMDFTVDKLSARFVFRNPNETSACGCGESVTLAPAKTGQIEGRA
ncbi:MAG TPA: iron-sulfur cluster assembly accessory protein [Xanthobacteraceae bacterium]|jgi:iron-sulfur cluster assembly protein